jgi:transposase
MYLFIKEPIMTDTIDSLALSKFYPADLVIESVTYDTSSINIKMRSKSQNCSCPKCNTESAVYHATHHRHVQDLPILGKMVWLDIVVREYDCCNQDCDVSSFTETINDFLNNYSQMTERLVDMMTALAIETSCEGCARILKQMNVKTSGDTVIRTLIKRYENQPVQACGTTVGIDDFAFKKRHTYGTVVVDEETHKTVAVLEGRDGASLREWLAKNKQVKTVTRDRASAYAKAVEEILPDCMQIADRFHLHQNLLDAVNRIIGREVEATKVIISKGDLDNNDDGNKSETNGCGNEVAGKTMQTADDKVNTEINDKAHPNTEGEAPCKKNTIFNCG